MAAAPAKASSERDLLGFGSSTVLRGTVGVLGKEAVELEKLSSSLESERQVETDLAEPELIDPVPEST